MLKAILRLLMGMDKKKDQFQRDIHIERYKHLNDEITRYRDLVWKIVGLSWGAYGALLFFCDNYYNHEISRSRQQLPEFFFWATVSITLTTVLFISFCEQMAYENQMRRYYLEVHLGLLDERWHHKREVFWRRNFVVSYVIFVAFTLAPLYLTISLNVSHLPRFIEAHVRPLLPI